ncbi:MAG: NHLP leader peptide family RiPP precursor, partial [Chlorobiaceae bacterium]
MNAMEQDQAIAKIIAKAWTDETYKQRLTEKPADVLKEEGVEIPDGMTFKVVENTPALFHFILPQKPDVELTENDLESVAGGGVIG